MERIKNFEDVWDTGHVTPASLSGRNIDLLKDRINAVRVVAQRWIYQGKLHQIPFFVRLLADDTGLVHYEHNDPRGNRIVVLNGDESRRLVIEVPKVDSRSQPDKGYLNLPPSPARFGGITWGCEGNDGHTDYLFDFDWNTGDLIRFARPTRPW